MTDMQTVWVLWSHTEGELPRIESVFRYKHEAELTLMAMRAIWPDMKHFELEAKPLM